MANDNIILSKLTDTQKLAINLRYRHGDKANIIRLAAIEGYTINQYDLTYLIKTGHCLNENAIKYTIKYYNL